MASRTVVESYRGAAQTATLAADVDRRARVRNDAAGSAAGQSPPQQAPPGANARQFANPELVDRAIGYGVEGHSVDGTDLAACLEVLAEAVERARNGRGPQLVVASLLRLVGHGEHDDAGYVDPALKVAPVGRDCMDVARAQIAAEKWADGAELDRWREQAHAQVEAAVATTVREPLPDPNDEDWTALSTARLRDDFAE